MSYSIFGKPKPMPEPGAVAAQLRRVHKVIKPELEKCELPQYKLEPGAQRLRILPPVGDSQYWMLPFETYQFPGSPEVVCPGSVGPGFGDDNSRPDNIVSRFRKWGYGKKNPRKEAMYYSADRGTPGENNKIKLQTRKQHVCWCLPADPELLRSATQLPPFKLLFGSAADGQFGGNFGTMHNIVALTKETWIEDPSKLKYGAIADAESGRTIIITKTKTGTQNRYVPRPLREDTYHRYQRLANGTHGLGALMDFLLRIHVENAEDKMQMFVTRKLELSEFLVGDDPNPFSWDKGALLTD